ncbi:MAG: serine/threonine-protein kinase [Pyrinomonadaceae bacterium]
MRSDDWKKITKLLSEALALDTAKRPEFIANCGLTDELRSELESLLALQDESASFMSVAASGFSKDFFPDDDAIIGQQIGAYRILREIGLGGMGAVYLAERNDGKFEQRVALKLLKREMNTSALRRRFQHEREILASLEHPNIARLLDAGTSEEKIPYIAMEYVDGLPIDEYCDSQDLGLNARLELFQHVCAAVDFAHRNLVVHRDLKPSNVLVTHDGVPKLLDFGISKIVTDEYEDADSATITRLGVMTPSYASPEQLRKESVTTLSDVYSLGVILFELLCGHRPFEKNEHDIRGIYDAVLDCQPVPPSSLISTEPVGQISDKDLQTKRTATSANLFRRTRPAHVKLSPQNIRGDLDNIVLKALRKEPERRYSSPTNFSEDVQRYLSGMTITARPNTFAYRTSKFVARNRFGVIAGAIVILAIIAGVVTTLWQAQVARAERAKAEKRFADVRTLANSFLFEFSPKIENLPGSMPARQLLVTRALEYLDSLSQESVDDLGLQSELAKAYEKVGDVQGNPDTPNIGDLKGALVSYEKAQVIRRRLRETDPDNLDKQADLAANLEVTADINMNGGAFAKADESVTEAIKLRESVAEHRPTDLAARSSLAKVVRLGNYAPFYDGRPEAAMVFTRRSLALFAELSDEFPDDAFVNYQHGNLHVDLGDCYAYMDDMPQAEQYVQLGLEILLAQYKKHPNDNRVRRATWVAVLKRAEYYREGGDYVNSLARYDQALELAKLELNNNPGSFQAKRDVVLANKQRAVTLNASGKFKDAIESFERAIEVAEQLKKEDPSNILVVYDIAGSFHDMSELHFKLGNHQAALAAAERAQENCNEVLRSNPDHTQSNIVTARSKFLVGKVLDALGSYRTALERYQDSRTLYDKLKAAGKMATSENKRYAELEAAIEKAQAK